MSLTGVHNVNFSPAFELGDYVVNKRGSSWRGQVVGTFSTDTNFECYAVEKENWTGLIRIYPADALESWEGR